ncbi:hypothetical protein Q8A73_009387 [Channa argus]|nr:hypothetical protein Q8A73_009387 [Channa argus]
MASDAFQYRALFEYKRERGDDISLQPGDLLTVPKASPMTTAGLECQEGDERSPKGWLHGINERTKEKGDFPGTFVEYVGVVRASPSAPKTWPRPVPPTPGGPPPAVGPQPPGAAASSEEFCGCGCSSFVHDAIRFKPRTRRQQSIVPRGFDQKSLVK